MICSTLLRKEGIRHGFTTRADGMEKPAEAGSCPMFTVRQVHGETVIVLDRDSVPGDTGVIEADAVLSCQSGHVAAVRTADCVPVLLAGCKGKCVCAVHSGWRGMVCGIITKAVAELQNKAGCDPENIYASAGPCIGACCYEVGREVSQEFIKADLEDAVIRTKGKDRIDLGLAAEIQLEQAGIPSQNVDIIRKCTSCHEDLFYSYRRDREHAGRQLNWIMAG